MKFTFAQNYHWGTEHFNKFTEFDAFLEKLSQENEEEFSKELYTSKKFLVVGIGTNGIVYGPHPDIPAHIEKQIKKELIRLYP